MFRRCSAVVLLVGLVACGGSSDSPAAPSRPLYTRTGTGNDVFDMPTNANRVRITGTYAGNSSNFIVWIGGQLVVNELLGTSWNLTTYTGNHQVLGGAVRIENSTGVAWTITEIR